jgi:hypothetical protein
LIFCPTVRKIAQVHKSFSVRLYCRKTQYYFAGGACLFQTFIFRLIYQCGSAVPKNIARFIRAYIAAFGWAHKSHFCNQMQHLCCNFVFWLPHCARILICCFFRLIIDSHHRHHFRHTNHCRSLRFVYSLFESGCYWLQI